MIVDCSLVDLIVDHSGKTPSNINVIYTSLKGTFSGLQRCRWQYVSIFIRSAVLPPKSAKFQQNSNLLQFKVIQGHRWWWQRIYNCNFLLVI